MGESLETLIINDGVQTIKQYAFWCSNLSDITIAGDVADIEEDAFVYVNTTEIKCPRNTNTWQWAADNGFTPVEITQ